MTDKEVGNLLELLPHKYKKRVGRFDVATIFGHGQQNWAFPNISPNHQVSLETETAILECQSLSQKQRLALESLDLCLYI